MQRQRIWNEQCIKSESIVFVSIIRHQPVHRISKGTAGLLASNKMHVKPHSKLSEQIRSKVGLHSICRWLRNILHFVELQLETLLRDFYFAQKLCTDPSGIATYHRPSENLRALNRRPKVTYMSEMLFERMNNWSLYWRCAEDFSRFWAQHDKKN